MECTVVALTARAGAPARQSAERKPHDGLIFTPRRNGGLETRHRHGLSKWIRDEIDLVAQRGERPDAVKLAERGAARLEKRLGRDHENAHGSGDFRMKP